ncbi:uncharacterized protein LOC144576848 [Callithrix jacchus]
MVSQDAWLSASWNDRDPSRTRVGNDTVTDGGTHSGPAQNLSGGFLLYSDAMTVKGGIQSPSRLILHSDLRLLVPEAQKPLNCNISPPEMDFPVPPCISPCFGVKLAGLQRQRRGRHRGFAKGTYTPTTRGGPAHNPPAPPTTPRPRPQPPSRPGGRSQNLRQVYAACANNTPQHATTRHRPGCLNNGGLKDCVSAGLRRLREQHATTRHRPGCFNNGGLKDCVSAGLRRLREQHATTRHRPGCFNNGGLKDCVSAGLRRLREQHAITRHRPGCFNSGGLKDCVSAGLRRLREQHATTRHNTPQTRLLQQRRPKGLRLCRSTPPARTTRHNTPQHATDPAA